MQPFDASVMCPYYDSGKLPWCACRLKKELDRETPDGRRWYWRAWHWLIGLYQCEFPHTQKKSCVWLSCFKYRNKEDRR